MQKKLKKVDEIEKPKTLHEQLVEKVTFLNNAYKSENGQAVDLAVKELFQFLDKNPTEDEGFYQEMKNFTYQKNNLKILATISTLMQENGRMPSNNEISSSAGLSANTVYKHLLHFKDHHLQKLERSKFQFMVSRILNTVFTLGVQGDIRACKVYLDYFNPASTDLPMPIKQTNHIQINNVQITQDELERLPAETLLQIESLIKIPLGLIKEPLQGVK